MIRRALAVACAALAFGPGLMHASPFTLDHLLRLERLGQVAIAPTEDAVAVEKIGPLDGAGPYVHDAFGVVLRSSVHIASTRADGSLRPLLGETDGQGVVLGGWSPDGQRLLVYRLRDEVFSAGLADAGNGSVQWLPGTPEVALWGRAAQWRGPDEVVIILRPDGALPDLMGAAAQARSRLNALWALTAEGQTAGRTVIGGGRNLDINPRPADGRLVLMRTDGSVRRLAEGRFHDLEISSGGRFVAAVRFTADRAFDPERPFLQGDFTERRELTLVDLDNGDVWEPLPGQDLIPNLLAWSPGGDRLLVWVRQDGQPWSEGRLVEIDAAHRFVETLSLGRYRPAVLETALRTELVAADWLADTPVMFAEENGRRDWIQLAPGSVRPLTAELPAPGSRLLAVWGDHLVVRSGVEAWRVDVAGHAERLGDAVAPPGSLTAGLFSRGQRFQFNSPPRQDWLMVRDDTGLRRVDLGTGETLSRAVVGDPAAAFSRSLIATRVSDEDGSDALALDDRILTRTPSVLSGVTLVTPEPVHHTDTQGVAQTSWLYRPASSSGPLPPLIVLPYPGAPAWRQSPTEEALMTNVQLMTAAGYAVLIPSLPRTGRAGSSDGMAQDILATVDAARGLAGFDPEKIILWGHSFGAWAAVTAATQSDRFAAVIAANGPYDLLSVWGQFPLPQSLLPEAGLPVRSRAGWVETGQGRLGAPPYADPQRYLQER